MQTCVRAAVLSSLMISPIHAALESAPTQQTQEPFQPGQPSQPTPSSQSIDAQSTDVAAVSATTNQQVTDQPVTDPPIPHLLDLCCCGGLADCVVSSVCPFSKEYPEQRHMYQNLIVENRGRY